MKKALVVGCDGQDGRLLIESLSRDGCRYFGIGRTKCMTDLPGTNPGAVRIDDREAVRALLAGLRPDEIYFLAAFHHSSEERDSDIWETFRRSYDTNVMSLVNFLDAIRLECPLARLFYASSSHVFGAGRLDQRLDEQTPFAPRSVYGISKLGGLLACRYFREELGVFASVGILFNHESGYRPSRFLSKRIVKGALEIKRGVSQELVLGDLSAVADWGYAPDYVEAMRAILALDQPDEFVVATGKQHSVSEFVQEVFSSLGLEGNGKVREDRSRLPNSSLTRIGNPQKLVERTGWSPTVDFSGLIGALIRFEEGITYE